MADDVAISVRGLGKRYRIGVQNPAPRSRVGRALGSLFHYMGQTLRRPSEQELLWALKDVTFDVRRGEVLGLIGHNGAGKSTLLKILSRITEPTEGWAELRGRVGSLLEVGTGFHPQLTGRENVYMNGTMLGMSRAEIDRKFDAIVAFSDVEKFLDTPVKHYSSGMRVRLGFAVAAHLDPEILLVDEVLAVGDAAFQSKCLKKVGEVSGQEGRTVIFVSHALTSISRLCGRCVLLDRGRVALIGPTGDVIASYLSKTLGVPGARTWDAASAPGLEGVTLRAVSMRRESGERCPLASVKERLRLEVAYEVATPTALRVVVAFWKDGVCAFSALEPVEREHERPGSYSATVTIPPLLLAEGTYLIQVVLMTSRTSAQGKVFVNEEDALSLQVTDPADGTTARGDYTKEKFQGVVRPRLEWTAGPAAPPSPVAPPLPGPSEPPGPTPPGPCS